MSLSHQQNHLIFSPRVANHQSPVLPTPRPSSPFEGTEATPSLYMVMPAERPQGIAPLYVSHPSLRKQKVPISLSTGGNLPARSRRLAATLRLLLRPFCRGPAPLDPMPACRRHVRTITGSSVRSALPRALHLEPVASCRLFIWSAAAWRRFSSRCNATPHLNLPPNHQVSSRIPAVFAGLGICLSLRAPHRPSCPQPLRLASQSLGWYLKSAIHFISAIFLTPPWPSPKSSAASFAPPFALLSLSFSPKSAG
jgi:hypothetical protein